MNTYIQAIYENESALKELLKDLFELHAQEIKYHDDDSIIENHKQLYSETIKKIFNIKDVLK